MNQIEPRENKNMNKQKRGEEIAREKVVEEEINRKEEDDIIQVKKDVAE